MAPKKRDPEAPVSLFIIRQLRKKAMTLDELRDAMEKNGYADDLNKIPQIIKHARDNMALIVYSFAARKYTSRPGFKDLFTWLRSRRRHSYTALARAQGALRAALMLDKEKIPKEMREEFKNLLSIMKEETKIAEANGEL
jgi:hypothetical protein